MQVIEGEMPVKLPETSEWKTYKAGASHKINVDQKFQVKISVQMTYLCQYK